MVLHYHIDDAEKFSVDPDIDRTHVTSSVRTTRRVHFRDEISKREDAHCAIARTMVEGGCDAVYLLAHSKGDAVCHLYSPFFLAHDCHGDSTSKPIHSDAVETPPEATLFGISIAFGTASFLTRSPTSRWVKTSHFYRYIPLV